jgi:hypothetical protein
MGDGDGEEELSGRAAWRADFEASTLRDVDFETMSGTALEALDEPRAWPRSLTGPVGTVILNRWTNSSSIAAARSTDRCEQAGPRTRP